jgi:hypothetical protein
MRVVVPYIPSALRAETVIALRQQGADVELVDVSGDVTSYWQLLRDLWQAQEDFLVVEHDIVVPPWTVAALETCPRAWCSVPEDRLGGGEGWWDANLQCNRFRQSAILVHPHLFDVMPEHTRHFQVLDHMALARLQRRIRPHVHMERLTTHLTATQPQGGYPWPSEIDTWPPALVSYTRWLAQFAPDKSEIPALEAEMQLARAEGRDDYEFLWARSQARWAADILANAKTSVD